MNKFRTGDLVRCINDADVAQDTLRKGEYYNVIKTYSGQVDLDIHNGQGWWQERFELVSTEKSLEDAFDEPDSTHWSEGLKYPETKPMIVKKTVEQLAIDVLQNTTGKLYTEREIMAVVSVVKMLQELENV